MNTAAPTKTEQLEQRGFKKEKRSAVGILYIGHRSFLTLSWPQGSDFIDVDVCTNYGSVDNPIYVLETIEIRGNFFIRNGVFLPEREVWIPQ